MRGNVHTRLAKLERGEADATLLAAAGLDRLGLDLGVAVDLLPAPAQGAVGIEVLAGNDEVRALVAAIDHVATHRCVAVERAFLAALGGDCRSAVAAQARCDPGTVALRAEILPPDGGQGEAGRSGGPAALARELLVRASPALRALFAP